MGKALEAFEAETGAGRKRSALEDFEQSFAPTPTAPTGQSAKDVAMRQIEAGDPSPSVPIRGPSQLKARALGAVQGFTSGFAPDILEMGGREPLAEALASAVDPVAKAGIEDRNRKQEGAAAEFRKDIDQTRSALPGEFLQGELVGAAAQPGPKLGAAAKGASMGQKVLRAAGSAGLAAGEGALYAVGTGGNAGVGAGASAGANLVAGRIGGAAQKLAARGESKAAAATAAVAAKQAAKEADDVAKAARAKVATAGAAPPVGPSATNQVVRVMSEDGKKLVAIGSVESMDGATATVFAGGKSMKVPADRLQPIKTVSSKGTVASPPRDADKLVAAAEKEATQAEKAAKKANTAAAKAERAAKPGGNKGFAKLAAGATVGGAGAYAIPSIVEDPDKAVEKLAKAAGGAAAGLALIKGKGAAGRLAEKGAGAASRALDTAAGRVTRHLAGSAAGGARRVGAGMLAKIVVGRQKGQDTSQLEQQALDGGATPAEVQSAINAGSRR